MSEGSRWPERSEYHRYTTPETIAAPDGGAQRSAIPSGASRIVTLHSGGAPLRDDLRLPSVIPSGSIVDSADRSASMMRL
ncbi:hypothetical protein Mal33_20580 [Rosistilla oblonga]|uniref:Uncharacterized protein n=1 Tax=Rosistilla oblonga TaxID=2527990 RepID=A0A518ISL7_9BACT|nr:hypothetical protein Mal33_20580 [Rosistilla oblonga]